MVASDQAAVQWGKHVVVESEDNEDAPPANQVEIKLDGQKSHSPSSDEEEDPKESAKEELSMSCVKLKLWIN